MPFWTFVCVGNGRVYDIDFDAVGHLYREQEFWRWTRFNSVARNDEHGLISFHEVTTGRQNAVRQAGLTGQRSFIGHLSRAGLRRHGLMPRGFFVDGDPRLLQVAFDELVRVREATKDHMKVLKRARRDAGRINTQRIDRNVAVGEFSVGACTAVSAVAATFLSGVAMAPTVGMSAIITATAGSAAITGAQAFSERLTAGDDMENAVAVGALAGMSNACALVVGRTFNGARGVAVFAGNVVQESLDSMDEFMVAAEERDVNAIAAQVLSILVSAGVSSAPLPSAEAGGRAVRESLADPRGLGGWLARNLLVRIGPEGRRAAEVGTNQLLEELAGHLAQGVLGASTAGDGHPQPRPAAAASFSDSQRSRTNYLRGLAGADRKTAKARWFIQHNVMSCH